MQRLALSGRDHSFTRNVFTTVLLPSQVVLDHAVAVGAAVVVQGGRVRAVGAEHRAQRSDRVVELEGALLPGFVDLHVNGAGGRDLSDASADALAAVASAVWQGGAVAFLPTLVTAPFGLLLERVQRLARLLADPPQDGAVPLGLHVEGPFLEVAGAHDDSCFCDPTAERVDALLAAAGGRLKLVTLAPGRPGAPAAVARFAAAGVAVALGHGRSADQLDACVRAGARLVTHLFNAMGPSHHRDPGLAGHALATASLACTLIVDGAHLHPIAVRNAFKCLGVDRTVLVTDSVAAAGMPDGHYQLGGTPVHLAGGVVRDEKGSLAGSALTMADAARGFLACVDRTAGPWTLARVAAANPARAVSCEDHGTIAPGRAALFSLLRPDGRIVALRA
jgi:N-acetylglucosamine-6-phosphate deacetylase